ncbi:MAG: hypothetical protein A2X85_08765 [Geobacteraceae bacterium GWF2_54_21]|nr:MAG: hypothetical protein A2X85_08765 [Geobacteraceae bacterium GWF2_54_21]
MRSLLLFMTLVFMPNILLAGSDGIYGMIKQPGASWDGTDANPLATPTTGYDFAYGDESTVVYTLPWSFTFYGQTYSQITVDTNGNIWFGYAGPLNSFDLVSNTNGPVIAAWNSDLSSYFSGGAFVQHKNDLPLGERVVVEWQAESYTDEGLALPNNFEIVLFQNGDIRADYKSFTAVNAKDSGSGISSNDNTHYLSITSAFLPVYQLSGNSYGFTTTRLPLQVIFIGTGGGIVTSNPAGIACNTGCSSTFLTGEQVTLHPAADLVSTFSGWSNGTCTGLGDCLLTLGVAETVTAGFERDTTHQVYVPGVPPTYYSTIQGAYNIATDASEIKIWATTYNESLDCNRPITVNLQGGYDRDYAALVGESVLFGQIIISDGSLIVDSIVLQ